VALKTRHYRDWERGAEREEKIHGSEDPPLQGLGTRRGERCVAEGAETAEAGEKSVSGGDVAGDLGAEFFWAAEFFFVAKALPEADFDALGGREGRSMLRPYKFLGLIGRWRHVEEMRFDAEGGAIERGAHADVGDRAAAELLAFEAGARDVDAAAGKQALFGGEV